MSSTTMRAVRLHGNRKDTVEDRPIPRPGADQVLIQMKAAGICDSDLGNYRSPNPDTAALNFVPGHEPCGVIIEIGSNVAGWSVGDPVVVYHRVTCKQCHYCLTGRRNLCPNRNMKGRRAYGFNPDGRNEEYMVVDTPLGVASRMLRIRRARQGRARYRRVISGERHGYKSNKRKGKWYVYNSSDIKIQAEHRDAFLESMLDDARGSVNDEPGCYQFDVIQDSGDPNKIYLYEVYKDEAALNAHLQAPHYIRWRDTVKDWFDGPVVGGSGTNIFPDNSRWMK